MNSIIQFLAKLRAHAFEAAVVRRAAIMSLIVGTILIGINHGNRICSGTLCGTFWVQSLLTMFVPYAVSTVSSVLAMDGCHRSEKALEVSKSRSTGRDDQ
ncbi:nitrate/nitrite transporter NrtS [Mariniblastus fucicola]|uniref:Uncharacterized protein n=1 Tax=Mariniblastus fucicola TaxID=980251 RepID=A0A5B9P692_9BACT|nr:nitrate/nitrite transporter NrtS [Mariniblastus fucicola]QEG21049.1 hypothetical protein MFFC18_09010 [Mariniblastus fucicola]